MQFAIVEFIDQEGGGLAIVNKEWITPRRKEVFWPPIKDQQAFNKLLRRPNQCVDASSWKLYKIKRLFYETDDYEIAKKKLCEAEVTSDIQTDVESEQITSRRRTKPRKLIESDSSDSDIDNNNFIPRPPKIQKGDLFTDIPCTPSVKSSANSQQASTSNELGSYQSSVHSTPTTIKVDTPSQPSENSAFRILLGHILHIKEEQKKILLKLEKPVTNILTELPEDFPIKFPLTTVEELEAIEVYLRDPYNFQKLVKYLCTLRGGNVKAKTNKILRYLMTNRLAAKFNYCGRSRKDKEATKKSFSELNLCKVMIDSVKAQSDFTTDMIEASIKNWLKHAPNRLLKEK